MINKVYTTQQIDNLLPHGYFSHISVEDKISSTYEITRKVEEKFGIDIIAATISGSSLRGADHKNSDTDFLLITDNKDFKAKSVEIAGNDVQIQNMDNFVRLLPRSIPYIELLQSPFVLVDDRYRAYLLNQKVNKLQLNKAIISFMETVIKFKASKKPKKTVVQLLSMMNLIVNHSSLMNRDNFNIESELAKQLQYLLIEEDMYHENIIAIYDNNVSLF